MNLNSVQGIIELSDAQFESILRAEVSIRSLITQETSVPLLKRCSKRFGSHEISSRYLEFILSRMLEIDPNDLSVLIALAWELWYFGEDEEGRKNLAKAQQINPNHKWVLYLEIALSSNIQDKIAILESLNTQYPDDTQVSHNLDALKSGKADMVLAFDPDECMNNW